MRVCVVRAPYTPLRTYITVASKASAMPTYSITSASQWTPAIAKNGAPIVGATPSRPGQLIFSSTPRSARSGSARASTARARPRPRSPTCGSSAKCQRQPSRRPRAADRRSDRAARRAGCTGRSAAPRSRHLLDSFIDLNNLALSRLPRASVERIGVDTCPGGDRDSTHSSDVDYAELLPSLSSRPETSTLRLRANRIPRRILRSFAAQETGPADFRRRGGADRSAYRDRRAGFLACGCGRPPTISRSSNWARRHLRIFVFQRRHLHQPRHRVAKIAALRVLGMQLAADRIAGR